MENCILANFAEVQLKEYSTFIANHESELGSIRKMHFQDVNTTSNVVKVCGLEDNEELYLPSFQQYSSSLTKVLLTFGKLRIEANNIVKTSVQLQNMFVFIDNNLKGLTFGKGAFSSEKAEQNMLTMSTTIDFFCEVQCFLERAIVIMTNLILQCESFLAMPSKEMNLLSILDAIAEILEHVLIFTEILSHSTYRQHWIMYKKTAEFLINSPETSKSYKASELNGLWNSLQQIEFIFSENVFRECIDSLVVPLKSRKHSKVIAMFIDNSNAYIAHRLSAMDKFQQKDFDNYNDLTQLIRVNVFCVVFYELYGQVDPKNVKNLLELNSKHEYIFLHSDFLWSPTHFLAKHTKLSIKTPVKPIKEFINQETQRTSRELKQLSEKVNVYGVQIATWIINVFKVLEKDIYNLNAEHFKEIVTLLLSGQRFAEHLVYIVQRYIHKHELLQMPLKKTTLITICKIVDLWQLIKHTCQIHEKTLFKLTNCLMQYLQYKILTKILIVKSRTSANHRDNLDESMVALNFAEKCFIGPPTNTRTLLGELALNANVFLNTNADQLTSLKLMIGRIQRLQHFMHKLTMPTASRTMSIQNTTETTFFECFIESKKEALKVLLADGNDFYEIVRVQKRRLASTNSVYDMETSEISKSYSGMCAKVETFLRLEALTTLLAERNLPFENITDDYRSSVNSQLIETNNNFIILKDKIENYFSKTFYNLTTISMQDWKIYERMRHLAFKRFALQPINDSLPNNIIDQGIDVLQVVQNIHIFVSKYAYNMNLQFFVEEKSANKHFETIGIRHMANSIRTHGTGIINTTINFIYQFLRQKFYVFSTFLYDEQIKSRLVKELRTVIERKTNKFPIFYTYEQADKFNKDIRKLGHSKDGETYMDLFRKVVTQVGNAMGYIRLVRSGCKNAVYGSSIFLPKFDKQFDWSPFTESDNFIINSTKGFDNSIGNVLWNFSDCTDYFQMLSKAFEPFFCSQHNQHVNNFFLIVPPLILNHVEHILKCNSKNKKNGYKTGLLVDDGFAMGLAFILKLLNQNGKFNELRWYTTLCEQFKVEREKIKGMLANISYSKNASNDPSSASIDEKEKLLQTLALTERRLTAFEREIDLLHYNTRTAELIFQ